MESVVGEHILDGAADQFRRPGAQPGRGIAGDPRDDPLRAVERDQESEGLDGPQEMDRFAVAVGQIDRVKHLTHAPAPP